MKVGFISLGCNKNLVDTEKTIALFKNHGYEIINDAQKAEIIVINTCGFIESAKQEAINTIKKHPQICPYFDIPIQHISDTVLKRMNRHSNGESIRKLIIKLRKELPNVILRTTVMVGFPGETKEEFQELYNLLQEAKFDKLGAFMYSKEEGTPAEKMKPQVYGQSKKSRYNQIMRLQQEISRKNLQEKVGKTYLIMIEGITRNSKYYVGRSYMDTPEIDGVVYIENTKNLQIGEFVNCEITAVKDYDLIGKIKNENNYNSN